MFTVRLGGGHLYGKQLFTWLSLVVSLMASFVLSFFPLDVLDGIWDLIESVSEGFLTYFYTDYSDIGNFDRHGIQILAYIENKQILLAATVRILQRSAK